jgi:hypothetical protein
MKADAIKLVAAAAVAGIEPTDSEQRAAIAEAVDIAIGFFENVGTIANMLENIEMNTRR